MGEILYPSENSFDKNTNCVWKDLNFDSDENVVLHIKSPKSRKKGGDFVDFFMFGDETICPVRAVRRLKAISKFSLESESPVFRFDSGKLLSKTLMNKTLKSLLETHLGKYSSLVYGHSFRSGIPSHLANFPEIAGNQEIMGWGRWSSSAYERYAKLELEKRRAIFGKIKMVLG